MSLELWLKGVAGAVAGIVILGNLPTKLWMPQGRAALSYLAGGTLKSLDGSGRTLKASDLWKDKGAVVLAVRRPG